MKKITAISTVVLLLVIGLGFYSYKSYRAKANSRDYKIYYGVLTGEVSEEKEEISKRDKNGELEKDKDGNPITETYIQKVYKNQKMLSEKDGSSTYDVLLNMGNEESENKKAGDWFTVTSIRTTNESLGYSWIEESKVPREIREELKK